MSLLDEFLKDQGRDTLKQSLEQRIQQYTQARNSGQAHLLVLEAMDALASPDAETCRALISDSTEKIAKAKGVIEAFTVAEKVGNGA